MEYIGLKLTSLSLSSSPVMESNEAQILVMGYEYIFLKFWN